MKARQFNDKEIIDGIINNNNRVFIFLYQNVKPDIVKYIVNLGGSTFDADDVFQIALIEIKRKLDNERINIKNNFKQYLFRTSIRIWQKEEKSKRKENINVEGYINEKDIIETEDENFGKKPSLMKVLKCFNYLKTDCQEIFRLRSEGMPYLNIAEKMKIREDYIRLKRKRCYEKLLNYYKNLER